MITGIWCVIGFDLSWRQTSKPSMSGIITSSSTMSHSARSHSASASAPLLAVVTSKYSADSRASSNLTLAGTSSTTRTRALIAAPSGVAQEMPDGLDELRHRDRFRQVGFAAPLADAFLVALHGERGHRNNRYRFEFGVVLEPLCHFQAGYFRQLNIHDDEIGPVLTREVERLDTVSRSDGLIAMRFQQIVEELHVQLVVLHNQDGLGHSPPLTPFSPAPGPRRMSGRETASPEGARWSMMDLR